MSSGAQASISCMQYALTHSVSKQFPNFSEPFYSLKYTVGKRKVLVVLWDPHRPDHPAPTKAKIQDLIFGPKPSVKDYFGENSIGSLELENAGILGWYDSDHPWQLYWRTDQYDPNNLQPGDPHLWVDVQGKYGEPGSIRYLDDDGFISGHTHKWAEAIIKAGNQINFKNFDIDNNGYLSPDELSILMVIPQNSPFGTQRPVVARHLPTEEHLIIDSVKIDTITEAYIGAPPSLGLVAHELSHILFGAGDMYFGFFQPYAAGPYSLMDQSPHNPPHLDPFHKLKLGWTKPKIISTEGFYKIHNIETTGEIYILYDPVRGDEEYFILENRWKGNSYDQYLPNAGLAVWHIIENPDIFNNLPTPTGVNQQNWNDPKWKGWARRGIRMIRPIYGPPINWSLWDGANPQTGYDLLSNDPNPKHVTLKWSDDTPSGFSILAIPPSSPEMTVQIKAVFQG